MSLPLIVTALMGNEDFAWADRLRRAYFPPERNVLRAHLTLFHHLPPSVEEELAAKLKHLCREDAPRATLGPPYSLGRGVAFRIESAELEAIRGDIAASFASMLTPQDRAGWRPHITVQNKVDPADARALQAELEANHVRRPFAIAGLAMFWYRNGPWETVGAWRFGSGHPMSAPC